MLVKMKRFHALHLVLILILLAQLLEAKPKRIIQKNVSKNTPASNDASSKGCPMSRHQRAKDIALAIEPLVLRRDYPSALACLELTLEIKKKEDDELIFDISRKVLGNYIEFCGCPSNEEIPRVSPRPSAIEILKTCVLTAIEYDRLYWILSKQYEAVGQPESTLAVLMAGVECIPVPNTIRYLADRISSQEPAKTISLILKAIEMEPENAHNYAILGTAHHHNGNTEAALRALEKSIQLDKHNFEGLHRLGSLYSIMGDASRAVHYLRQAIDRNPRSSLAHDNLGIVYYNLNKLGKAATSFEASLRHDPNNILAMTHLARTYEMQDRLGDSLKVLNRALKVNPDWKKGFVSREKIKQSLASGWSNWIENMEKVKAIVVDELSSSPSTELSMNPFECLTFPLPSIICRRIARRAAMRAIDSVCSESQSMREPCEGYFDYSKVSKTYGHGIARIGYVSPDFRNHPVTKCIFPLFKQHNRDMVSVYSYSISTNDGSIWREHVKNGSDKFVEESGTEIAPNVVMARKIKQDEIDILVNLGGFTAHSRPPLFALRPAPVQINFFGYLGTMGHPRLAEYIVTDRITTPAIHVSGKMKISASSGSMPDEFDPSIFAERVIYMPHTFFFSSLSESHSCEDRKNSDRFQCFCPENIDLADEFYEKRKAIRKKYGLPPEKVIFSATGGVYKISPRIMASWVSILNKVPNSILLLSRSEGMTEIEKNAKRFGLVDTNRIVFSESLPFEDYIEAKSVVDIALDTPLYNGHSSSADMLFAGIPLISLPGSQSKMVSRVSASLIDSLGLGSLIAKNYSHYEDLAVNLAKDNRQRLSYRKIICDARTNSSLFSVKKWTKEWDRALGIVYELHSSGKKPRAIVVNNR